VLRRIVAITLTAVLLAPWIAALSGAAVPVVPCPMHRSGKPTSPDRAKAVAVALHESAHHQTSSHHGTSARGCNCAGECGRSGSAFTLPARELVRLCSRAIAEAILAEGRSDFSSATRLLPPATGPPKRLRI
jgi:hypothetical protein